MLKEIEIANKSLMMIFLLEECNFECPHCVREDEPMDRGYTLSSRQLKLCLSDCRSLKSIDWIHFSGGEPTLWREGELGLVDLLLEISSAGFTPGFTTNGSLFVDEANCRDFLENYVDRSTRPLFLYISIDTFHNNFDPGKRRALSLDNVLEFKRSLSREKADLLDIRVLVVVSRDATSLLPEEMIQYYTLMGVSFVFVPLTPKGKARKLGHLCPDLNGGSPEDLGAYFPFRRKSGAGEPEDRSRAQNLILIGGDYYLPDPWRKIGRLGHIPDEIVRIYSGETSP
jgi:MoaA/NifB/PqqE/SkfB family radical SAM enzyme